VLREGLIIRHAHSHNSNDIYDNGVTERQHGHGVTATDKRKRNAGNQASVGQ